MSKPGSMSGAVTDVVDVAALARWMDEKALGSGPLEDIATVTGGTQNVMMRFSREGKRYVLRRPPPHKRANSDAAICREMMLLKALGKTKVRHPRMVAGCEDTGVLGASFYLMEWIEGFNAGDSAGLPEPHRSSKEMRHAMGLSMVDAIAELGKVDFRAVGLEGFGKPEGFLERQSGRWKAELEKHLQHEGYNESELSDVSAIGDWLAARVPKNWMPGIIHGDYHLANVMFSKEKPEIVAIVDWEMSTLGDPLLDLGWILATSPIGGPSILMPMVDWSGFPTREELIARYAENTTRDLSAIDWYQVLACYKLGIILEGTYARARAGKAPRATGDLLHTHAVGLIEQAHGIIAG